METSLIITQDNLSQAQQVFDMLDVNELTRQSYKKNIKPFISFMEGKMVGINTFIEYKRYLSGLDFEVSTKNNYFHSAKTILKELNRIGVLPADITQNVKCFKQEKKHKRFGLNQEEVQKVCEGLDKINDLRMKVIFSLLIFQGLRQKELRGMDAEDIDLKNMTAKVTGKGRDDYELIDLHPETVKILRKYLEQVSFGPLFPSVGNRNKGARISTRQFRRIVKNFLTELEIENSTHGFRHYFITTLAGAMDIEDVRQRARLKSIDVIQVYNDELKMKKSLPNYYGAFNVKMAS